MTIDASNSLSETLPRGLSNAVETIYRPNGLIVSEVRLERESAEYGACMLKLNGAEVRFRVAKITPTKIGQFVTLWKRLGQGPIQPFDAQDLIDFVVVSCSMGSHRGHFVFPRGILCERDVFAQNGKGGKRAIRVYPPWDRPISKQAIATQNWQVSYFLEVPNDQAANPVKLRKLFGFTPA